jgi:hypothetical protein
MVDLDLLGYGADLRASNPGEEVNIFTLQFHKLLRR